MSMFFGKRTWIGVSSLVAISGLWACAMPAGEATGESSEAVKGHCSSNADCSSGKYCAFPSGADEMCGSTAGTCTAKPGICPDDIVAGGFCGCDGKGYGNACFAARAGVSVAYQGPCGAVAGDLCGGPTDIACGAGLYCELASGDACGAVGTCTARPTRCPYFCESDCESCDGSSFCNPCLAARAGATVSSSSCP